MSGQGLGDGGKPAVGQSSVSLKRRECRLIVHSGVHAPGRRWNQ